jgi:NAD(P)H-hydrate epimerase
MFKVVTTERMRAIEAAAAASGIAYAKLMEYAGRAVADRALQISAALPDPKITVLVGAGNNGGDGMVAGLFIAQDRPAATVRFYLLKERHDEFTQVARQANLMLVTAEHDVDKRLLRNMIASSDVVLDALFGIGVRLPLREEAARVLRTVNQALHERRNAQPPHLLLNPSATRQIPRPAPIYVLAVDCPSGTDCDTGELDKNALFADETVTFIAAKRGQFLFPAAAAVGDLTLSNAGVPLDFKEFATDPAAVLDAETVRRMLPVRAVDGNKGTFGKALIVGGCARYVGAPALAASAAYRSGAGLVTVATPEPVAGMLAPQQLETTWLPLPHENGFVQTAAAAILQTELPAYDALLVGVGLGRAPTTDAFLQQIVTNKLIIPLVLDADALNILAEQAQWWQQLPPNTILTPHPGEMARLTKRSIAEVQTQRWALVQAKAQEWNVILLLKGAHTLIAAPNGELAVLPFKTDALAKAGTGDVLAGIIAGLLAQGLKPLAAAICGAYLHGLAGKRLGTRSAIASDVTAMVGRVLAEIAG